MRVTGHLRAAARASALWFTLYQTTSAQVPGFDVFATPTNNEAVNAGSNFDILWAPSAPAGRISILLMQGASELEQEFGPTIATGIDSPLGKYTWSIPSSYGDFPSYGFKLQLDSDPTIFQYSYPFRIIKISASSAPSTTASSTPQASTVFLPTTNTVTVGVSQTTNTPPTTTSAPPKAATTTQAASVSSKSSTTPNPSSSAPSSNTTSELGQTTSTSAGTSSSSQTAPSTTSSGSSSSPATDAGNSSLSTGAKVGIGIGSAIGICIVGLLAYIAILLRRRRTSPDSETHKEERNEIQESGLSKLSEMDGNGKPAELATTKENPMAELAGGRSNGIGRANNEGRFWNEDMAEMP